MNGVNNSKKVCIVVPVYNAEKFLGYCLNSILSQSYTNWTAILVDDGSKDGSLEICNRYAKLDPRFKVISQPNGGVSKARNKGLEFAEGDYLEFLDSDDCLAQDTLAKQIALAEEYNSQLVLTDIMMVDFTNPESSKVMLTSAWLKESPCCLSAEEFKAKRMQLVWFTVLLECLHGKLYDLNLWKKLELKFPEDLSLGEDFVANMRYFENCNNAVFLRECGHYYNCIQGSGSLAQKYRKDLFENKMLLMEKLEAHLGGRENLADPEKDAFYCYTASSGLGALERDVLDSGMAKDQLIARIKQMLAHGLFAESLQNASYIPDRFVECVNAIKKNNLGFVVDYIAEDVFRKTHAPQQTASGEERKPGFVNRVIRKLMRMSLPLLGKGTMAERVGRWERDFAWMGVAGTCRYYRYLHKKINVAKLENQTKYLEEKLWSANATQTRNIQQLEEKLTQQVNEVTQQVDAAVLKVQENVNGDIWNSEERLRKEAYLREVNDLRQRKKAIMLGTAEHCNIGDAAITLAEQMFLQKYFPDYYQVEISTYEMSKKEAFLHAILNDEDILFINGGGNLGDVYLAEEEMHRQIVETFPNQKIIIFPQTIYFTSTENGRKELEKSAKVYNRHPDLTLYVRGQESVDFARTHFTNVKTVLMPDMVHQLQTDYRFDREGILLSLRDDGEGVLTNELKAKIKEDMAALTGTVTYRNNMNDVDIGRDIRGMVVRKELMCFAKHQVVVTDRLHGMIFAAITGTPCVVLASFNQKIREYYNTFFQGSQGIYFLDGQTDKVLEAVQAAMEIGASTNNIMEGNPHRQIFANAQGNKIKDFVQNLKNLR